MLEILLSTEGISFLATPTFMFLLMKFTTYQIISNVQKEKEENKIGKLYFQAII